MVDHCNGLLLYSKGKWIPPKTHSGQPRHTAVGTSTANTADNHEAYLMFDPVISPHYEVFLIQNVPKEAPCENIHDLTEWPPCQWKMNVFSSRSRQWQERSFVREGEVVETMANVLLDSESPSFGPQWRYGEYWQGALYVRALPWWICHKVNLFNIAYCNKLISSSIISACNTWGNINF
jgi:hypothetical protein